jgi:hypothetical protein
MKIKETRGRPKKYNFDLKKGDFIVMKMSNGARVSALAHAKVKGWIFRTWQDKGKLNIKRVE